MSLKKILEITEEAEKHLVAIMDAALKSAGMGAIAAIDKIRGLIQFVAEKSEEPVATTETAPEPVVAPNAETTAASEEPKVDDGNH